MSITILYDRKFIRTTRGILPMILIGSSNSTEILYDKRGNPYERRERYWRENVPQSLAVRDWPEQDHVDAFRQSVDGQQEYDMFRSNSRWITSRTWERWFINGCKRACTLEDYRIQNKGVSLIGYLRICSNATETTEKEELRTYLHTTTELEEWLDKANLRRMAYLNDPSFLGQVTTTLAFFPNEPLVAAPGKIKDGEQIVVKHGRSSYVEKYEKGRSLTFTQDLSKAAVFPSIEKAQNEIGTCWKEIRFIKKPSGPPPERPFVLRVASGLRFGLFVQKRVRNTLHYARRSDDARTFRNVKDAQRYAKEIFDRFSRSLIDRLEVVNTKKEEETPILVLPEEEVA